MNHFKGKHFQQDVIIVAVGYYLRYNLSYREAQELLYDRGRDWTTAKWWDIEWIMFWMTIFEFILE